jgi:hypothetical protein
VKKKEEEKKREIDVTEMIVTFEVEEKLTCKVARWKEEKT